MDLSTIYLLLTLLIFSLGLALPSNNNTLLLLVSFDGFRYDYFNRNLTENLLNLKTNSSHSPYMLSVFPSKTFPNHFSIATGLYTEVHGVLDNKIYDVSTNKSIGYGPELFHYNEDVVPIWILNERGGGGRRSGCVMWPGCDLPYQHTLPSHYFTYNVSTSWESRVDTLISWFTHPETPINLGVMYFEQPDLTCHSYGPDSPEVDRQIARVDKIVQYLLDKAVEVDLLHRLNIVFVSDHGGQAVPVPSHNINLDTYINRNLYIRGGVAPNLQIFPVPGKEEEVLSTLKDDQSRGANFTAYTKAEMLDRWRYKHCNRTPPILLCADLGYLFLDPDHQYPIKSPEIGNHGYDPLVPSMRAFFMAVGPEFKKNFSVQPFENINIYPLAAHILGIPLPTLKPNGSISFLKDVLVSSKPEQDHNIFIYLVVGVIAGALVVIFAIGVILYWRKMHCKDQSRRPLDVAYRELSQTADGKEEETPLSDNQEDDPNS
ncbi:ectonucleotide pyrophosphatase/phosphodiesterase family member 5-like isoform X1 [Macrosteles quadrilineatus]|uniref:ectonucleotide pyrophosphatase/phosphodiesterase family member 5-like isoform X1 n=2 Tax=Macrosteles quadrilineatus TaxID=74068 RepID=UPI0023E2EE11|nr:ectonucleotide pyrophosphatase/phosphodiesterase family member 5-like isoform X1 [Macrosteles quadrilineatus]